MTAARRTRTLHGLTPYLWGFVAITCLVLAACGKRGSPRPPLPRGPHPPGAVAARQIGRRAVVGFDVPQPKGDKPSQQPVRAELVRVTYRPGFQPPADPDAFRRRGDLVGQIAADPMEPGSRLFLEDLQLGDLADGGIGWTLRYAVRVRDRRGRLSPLVITEDLELLESAPAPRELAVEPTADGVRLVWRPPEGEPAYTYNVYRSHPEMPWPEMPLNPAPLAANEYLDREVTTGERYTYTVRVSLSLEKPYREGEPSETREIVAEDRFAPAPPQGLVAVQEGPAVRLFWNPNPERDLAGYRVSRSVDGGAWSRVGPPTNETPSFLDHDVEVGRRVAYRVEAIDRADPPNVSEPSVTVEIAVVAEPVAPGPGAP
jgi:hypothetical protein